jgi:hypothetical protein
MIQCGDCEFCHRSPGGEMVFSCDPFSNIKEPECLQKWQLLKLNALLHYQEQMHSSHERLAPMQEKLFNYMEREIEDQNEAESWKQSLEDDDDEGETLY